MEKMEISSLDFENGEFIPKKYTCEGANISLHLRWFTKLKSVRTYALIVDDPDAPGGDFVHWVVYNIPSNINEFTENLTPTQNVPDGVIQGTNGAGKIGYIGPCPPSGKHRYNFKIYALDTVMHHLGSGAEKYQLINEMKGHILAEGSLTGKYKKELE